MAKVANRLTSLTLRELLRIQHSGCGFKCLSTSPVHHKNIRSGQYKTTRDISKPLTYEEAQKPHEIGLRKSWNSWNTSNLDGETEWTAQTTFEDFFIRKFMSGTWHNLFVSEIIVKRRANIVYISGIIHRGIHPRKVYFLLGYTEELLSRLLKRPVKIELQSVDHKKDMIFRYI